MAVPSRRPADPVRDPLVEVRRALLRLHKALIDSERARFETGRQPLTSAQFLGALLEDPFFQWLRPYSQLIAAMDEAIFAREPVAAAAAREMVERAHALASPAEGGGAYGAALARDAGVHVAHTELTRRVAAALLAYQDAA
jgi:hypothetical protein